MGFETTPGFPTLAEQLADRPREPEAPLENLTALLEGRAAVASAPDVVSGAVVTVPIAEQALEDLLDVVRGNPGDVLLVSEAGRLTPPILEGLRAALAGDSACTTVSLDEGSHPVVEGVPPPAIDHPRAGVVLVRRTDLLLACDEADLTGRFVAGSPREAGGGPIVSELLALLERPGFVHRAVGLEAPAARPAAMPARGRARGTGSAVVLDGSCLAHPLTGTQVQVLELADALARAGADLTVMRPPELHPTVDPRVVSLTSHVRFAERHRLGRPVILHRPFQVVSLHDLTDRLEIGERFVLTHQDMIWDRTRAYHVGDARRDYRTATSAALSVADEVGFFSFHAAIDAASDGALALDRATVVPLGVDHLAGRDVPETLARPLAGRPYLLMVGTSFWHKNRVFSLRLLQWLVDVHRWDGGLVLVGGHHERTSSRRAEELFLAQASSLSDRVVDLGHVPEGEQLALYRDAALVLFPSLYEGFGFIPFEAAALGTACVYARRPAMDELLPAVGALPSFELDEAGAFVAGLLSSPAARAGIVEAISEIATRLTWDRTAAGYLAVYERALARPRRDITEPLRAGLEAARGPRRRRRTPLRVALDSALRARVAMSGRARRADRP